MQSKARSTALASAVKIDESLGIRWILLWLSDKTAQPTLESSFDLSVYLLVIFITTLQLSDIIC